MSSYKEKLNFNEICMTTICYWDLKLKKKKDNHSSMCVLDI